MAINMQYLKLHAFLHSLRAVIHQFTIYESQMKIETTRFTKRRNYTLKKNFCSKQCANQRFRTYLILRIISSKRSNLLKR